MPERYLVTGCAGFIASKVADSLLRAGHAVVGVDNLNDAYDPRLKQWRLAQLLAARTSASTNSTSPTGAAIEPLFSPPEASRPSPPW